MPAITLAANQSINIGTMPSVALASGSQIKINNDSSSPIPVMTSSRAATVSKTITVAGTNAKLIKTGKSAIYFLHVTNQALLGALRYIKIYDKATIPVVGTDIPVLTFPIQNGLGTPLQISVTDGIPFVNGIGIAVTVNIGDLDVTAITAGDVIVSLVVG